MPKQSNRTKSVISRITPETFAAAEKVAQVTGRTVSSLIEYALQRYIDKNFPEAMNPDSKVKLSIELDDI